MNQFRADLHCHSICSDGTDEPKELLIKAKEMGLQGLSITDHDSIDAYTPALFEEAKTLEIELMTGVELSSEFNGSTVHVLGYHFDSNCPLFRDFITEMRRRREERNLSILQKLEKQKMKIDIDELKGIATVGRPHIAALLVKKGYVNSLQEAFTKYLKDGALCSASYFRLTPTEAIQKIHEAKGKAIIAHPHFYPKTYLKRLLNFNFDGIECHYGSFAKEVAAPFLEIAKKKDWIATGGSDYHGKVKPHLYLGASYVGRDVFEKLRS